MFLLGSAYPTAKLGLNASIPPILFGSFPSYPISATVYMLSAKLVLIDIEQMPKTHNGLRDWVIEKSKEKMIRQKKARQIYPICMEPQKTNSKGIQNYSKMIQIRS